MQAIDLSTLTSVFMSAFSMYSALTADLSYRYMYKQVAKTKTSRMQDAEVTGSLCAPSEGVDTFVQSRPPLLSVQKPQLVFPTVRHVSSGLCTNLRVHPLAALAAQSLVLYS